MTCGCRDQCECSDERLLDLRINRLENYVGADFLTPDDKKKMLERIQFERQNGLLI